MEKAIKQLGKILKGILSTAHSLEILEFQVTSSLPQVTTVKEDHSEEKNIINSLPINSLEDIFRVYKEILWYLEGRTGMEVINTLQEHPFNQELQTLGFNNLMELEGATNKWVTETNYRGIYS